MKKTIVVCGGSKGIGAATVKLLIEKNFKVICVSRTIGELADLEDNIEDFSFLSCDLSSPKDRTKAIDELKKTSGICGIVNNASGPSTGPMVETVKEDFMKAFETHLFAADEFVKALISIFKTNGEGRIVNIISVTARIPLENMGVSNTLRGAMLNWSKTLSKELGKFNITVNNVLPGYTETNRLNEVISQVSEKFQITKEQYSQKIIDQIPLGRFGRPQEIAAVAAFLLSSEASFISGASIPVDGGWTPCP